MAAPKRLGRAAALAAALAAAGCSTMEDAVGDLGFKPAPTREEQLRAVFEGYRVQLGEDYRGLVIANLGEAYLDAMLDGARITITLPPGRRFRETAILRAAGRPSLLVETQTGRPLARLTFSKLGGVERWGGLFDPYERDLRTDYVDLAARLTAAGEEEFSRRANQSKLRMKTVRGEPGRLSLTSLTEIADAERNKQVVSIWDSVARIGDWAVSLRSSDALGVSEEEAWALHRAVMISLFVEPPQISTPAAEAAPETEPAAPELATTAE